MIIEKKTITCADIRARLPNLFTDSVGSLNVAIDRVSSPEIAGLGSIIFLGSQKAFKLGISKDAAAIVVSPKMKEKAVAEARGRTILISPTVELAMAKVTHEFFLKTPYKNRSVKGIHPSVVLGEGCTIASDVRIGPNVVIGDRVTLAEQVYIGANSVIEEGVEIGRDTTIHPLVYIGHSTSIGSGCEILPQSTIGKEGFGYAHDLTGKHTRIPHQGRVIIEDDVHIGSSCTVDRGTVGDTIMRSGTKMDNQAHLAHNCEVGRNSLLVAGFLMAGSSKAGNNFLAGGSSVVTGHIEITDNVQLAGLSAVTKGITQPGQYGGFPLMPLAHYLKTKAAIAQLVKMRHQLKLISKKLGLSDTDEEPENV